MFMTQNQLQAALNNREKTTRHEWRMRHDAGYRERIEREAREYEEFVKIYGEAPTE